MLEGLRLDWLTLLILDFQVAVTTTEEEEEEEEGTTDRVVVGVGEAAGEGGARAVALSLSATRVTELRARPLDRPSSGVAALRVTITTTKDTRPGAGATSSREGDTIKGAINKEVGTNKVVIKGEGGTIKVGVGVITRAGDTREAGINKAEEDINKEDTAREVGDNKEGEEVDEAGEEVEVEEVAEVISCCHDILGTVPVHFGNRGGMYSVTPFSL